MCFLVSSEIKGYLKVSQLIEESLSILSQSSQATSLAFIKCSLLSSHLPVRTYYLTVDYISCVWINTWIN